MHVFTCFGKTYNVPQLVSSAAEGDSQHGCTLLSVEWHSAFLINRTCNTYTHTYHLWPHVHMSTPKTQVNLQRQTLKHLIIGVSYR